LELKVILSCSNRIPPSEREPSAYHGYPLGGAGKLSTTVGFAYVQSEQYAQYKNETGLPASRT
jgi:hypothetical protein